MGQITSKRRSQRLQALARIPPSHVKLPGDLWREIAQFLTLAESFALEQSCKALRVLSIEHGLLPPFLDLARANARHGFKLVDDKFIQRLNLRKRWYPAQVLDLTKCCLITDKALEHIPCEIINELRLIGCRNVTAKAVEVFREASIAHQRRCPQFRKSREFSATSDYICAGTESPPRPSPERLSPERLSPERLSIDRTSPGSSPEKLRKSSLDSSCTKDDAKSQSTQFTESEMDVIEDIESDEDAVGRANVVRSQIVQEEEIKLSIELTSHTVEWKIDNFTKRCKRKQMRSITFQFGGHSWRGFLFPYGNKRYVTDDSHMSLYIENLTVGENISGLNSFATKFEFAVVNKDESKSIVHRSSDYFSFGAWMRPGPFDRGWHRQASWEAVKSDPHGFFPNDTLTLRLKLTPRP